MACSCDARPSVLRLSDKHHPKIRLAILLIAPMCQSCELRTDYSLDAPLAIGNDSDVSLENLTSDPSSYSRHAVILRPSADLTLSNSHIHRAAELAHSRIRRIRL